MQSVERKEILTSASSMKQEATLPASQFLLSHPHNPSTTATLIVHPENIQE